MSTLLKAKNVTKIYPKAQHPSLDNVSFDVAEREFIAIMGASGSGKTTLLNVLSTIDTPTSGSITINGVSLKALDDSGAADFRRDYLGFIFQEYLLLDSLTIFENIAVPLTLQKLPPWKIESMIQGLSKTFGIDSQLSKYPGELSGGQRQRDCALRAIVKRPGILFADEPTRALDSASATDLLNTLKKSKNKTLHPIMQGLIFLCRSQLFLPCYRINFFALRHKLFHYSPVIDSRLCRRQSCNRHSER